MNSAQQVGASLGTAILNTVAASATLAYVTTHSGAWRGDALVYGYAAAAIWAAVLLVAGAAMALTLTGRFEYR